MKALFQTGDQWVRLIALLPVSAVCLLAVTASAQVTTNLPPTLIQNFELQTDAVIVRGFQNSGSMTTSAGMVSIRCKESVNVNTGRRQFGIALILEEGASHRDVLIVDYDELEPLLNGLDYLGTIGHGVTAMPAFDATFTTKSGLRIAAHSDRAQGGMQDFLQFGSEPRIPLTADQFTQFRNLIGQAKATLDTVQQKNSTP